MRTVPMPLVLMPLVLIAVAACGGEPTKESAATVARPAAKTSTAAVVKPTTTKPPVAAASLKGARAAGPSSVCAKYTAQLRGVQGLRAANPGSAPLKQQETSLTALIADACS